MSHETKKSFFTGHRTRVHTEHLLGFQRTNILKSKGIGTFFDVAEKHIQMMKFLAEFYTLTIVGSYNLYFLFL